MPFVRSVFFFFCFRQSKEGGLFMSTECLERNFQAKLIKEIKVRFPGCMVLKNDPNYIQGIPDLLILYNNKWAALECKKTSRSSHRPNQEYYISKMSEMSFASFISKDNKEEVLNAMEQSLSTP